MTKTASKQCGEAVKMNVQKGKRIFLLLAAVCLLTGGSPLFAGALTLTGKKLNP